MIQHTIITIINPSSHIKIHKNTDGWVFGWMVGMVASVRFIRDFGLDYII